MTGLFAIPGYIQVELQGKCLDVFNLFRVMFIQFSLQKLGETGAAYVYNVFETL